MNVRDVYKAMDAIAPFNMAEKWDNVGLLVGDMENTVDSILLALDITPAVIEEAVALKSNLIITHHPVIFSPLKKISSSGPISGLLYNNINVIAAHTNLDMASGGVNVSLSEKLELLSLKPLHISYEDKYYKIIVFTPKNHTEDVYSNMVAAGAGVLGSYTGAAFIAAGEGRFVPDSTSNPTIGKIGELSKVEEDRLELLVSEKNLALVIQAIKNSHPYEKPAFDVFENRAVTDSYSLGCVGQLKKPMIGKDFAAHVKNQLSSSNVRYTNPENIVSLVGVCSGSGGDFIQMALNMKVDAFVTGEVKHHQILEANAAGITLVDAGHFSTENIFMEPLKGELLKYFPHGKIYSSKKCTDGIYAL